MRVNVYAEEMTDRIEIIAKEIDGHQFTGLRFYLELPATVNGQQYQGPFMHRPGDDDSGAVTFWGKTDLRAALRIALAKLDEHYAQHGARAERAAGEAWICKVCACPWRRNAEGSWSLFNSAAKPGKCCDNSPDFLRNIDALV